MQRAFIFFAGFTCSSPVGLFADPFSCEHFYLCANGHPYRQKCPFGLIFDGALCNWKYDRSCLFQDSLWLREIRRGPNKRTRPSDPQRHSKIDIQKIPKSNTQIIRGISFLYSTPNEITVNVNDPLIEEGKEENEREANIPTVKPLGRTTEHTEVQQNVVSMLDNKGGINLTNLQEPPDQMTQYLEQNENVKLHLHKTQSPKVQNRWNEVQRRVQQQQRRGQWIMQRKRQWRLQMRRRLQQQWKFHQEQRKKQQPANVNYSLNQTTISTRFMAGKVATKPGFISRSPEKISRKWWRLYWTERLPRSEKTTSPLLLFPIRHKVQSSATIAIQAFGFKKTLDNSRGISNNSLSRNVGNLEKKNISNDYNENSENSENNTNNFAENNRINTDSNSINTNHSTSTNGKNIGKINNNTHVINNATNNATNNASSTNTNISVHYNNNSTDNFKVTSNMDIISDKITNSNPTTSYTMNNNNATIFNSSNSSNSSNHNNSVLRQVYASTTDAMIVFITSQNSNKRSDFSNPFTKKEKIEKFKSQHFPAA